MMIPSRIQADERGGSALHGVFGKAGDSEADWSADRPCDVRNDGGGHGSGASACDMWRNGDLTDSVLVKLLAGAMAAERDDSVDCGDRWPMMELGVDAISIAVGGIDPSFKFQLSANAPPGVADQFKIMSASPMIPVPSSAVGGLVLLGVLGLRKYRALSDN